MARVKKLKSVAYGLCDHFLSLYNRINGYWALGVLYKQALSANAKSISFELLSKSIEPKSISARETLDHMNEFFCQLLDNHNIESNTVKKACINITFDVEPTNFDLSLVEQFGNPLICEVVLTDFQNRRYTYQMRDRCIEYDKRDFAQNFHNKSQERISHLRRLITHFRR